MPNFDLTLDSGHEVRVVELAQRVTYGGVLEGVPNKRRNRTFLEEAVRRHSAMAPHVRCHLFEPMERSFPNRPHVSLLPAIECAALLRRVSEADVATWELLVVVWYQDEYAMPIDPAVERAIEALDWKGMATLSEM